MIFSLYKIWSFTLVKTEVTEKVLGPIKHIRIVGNMMKLTLKFIVCLDVKKRTSLVGKCKEATQNYEVNTN